MTQELVHTVLSRRGLHCVQNAMKERTDSAACTYLDQWNESIERDQWQTRRCIRRHPRAPLILWDLTPREHASLSLPGRVLLLHSDRFSPRAIFSHGSHCLITFKIRLAAFLSWKPSPCEYNLGRSYPDARVADVRHSNGIIRCGRPYIH